MALLGDGIPLPVVLWGAAAKDRRGLSACFFSFFALLMHELGEQKLRLIQDEGGKVKEHQCLHFSSNVHNIDKNHKI